MNQQISDSLAVIFAVVVLGALVLQSIKEGGRKVAEAGRIKPEFYILNRWSAMIPVFLFAYVISLSYLDSVFGYLGAGIATFAAFEFKKHVVGSILVGGGAALLVGVDLASAYFIYKFWRARALWGAFLFFVFVLVTTALAVKGVSMAEQRVREFYCYPVLDKSELVKQVVKREGMRNFLAEHLVTKWYEDTAGDRQQKQREVVTAFYFLVSIAAIPATWVMIKFFALVQVYLLKRSHSSEGS